jgi:hypothetical protein
MMQKCKQVLARGCEVASNAMLIAVFGLCLLSGAESTALAVAEPVVVTELVDVDAGITTAITTIAGTVAACVGGWFGFMLVRKAMRWGRRAVG